MIEYLPSLIQGTRPIEFHSCFVSYAGEDPDFAELLVSRLHDAGIRVWFAPEHIKGGHKLIDQLDRAIQRHDKLLLVLSEHSMKSDWVAEEIHRAREAERGEGNRRFSRSPLPTLRG